VPRFFCLSSNISQERIILDDKEQIHHLRNVLRLRLNDKVSVFDEKGNEYDCLIDKLADKVTLIIKDRRLYSQKEKISITVACAIPKKAKFDDIVDKLTQLGVDRIIPLETERVVVRWDKQKKALQRKRWEKIALSACRQSQRSTLPTIEPIKGIKEALAKTKDYGLRLIPTLSGERRALKEILAKSKADRIIIFIGPEGDFTPEEVDLAVKEGSIPVTLGDFVLRVDTAAVAAVSFIRLHENH
jgi:16S rRNA (uracil1498-N3)-methyltransferase